MHALIIASCNHLFPTSSGHSIFIGSEAQQPDADMRRYHAFHDSGNVSKCQSESQCSIGHGGRADVLHFASTTFDVALVCKTSLLRIGGAVTTSS